MSSKSFSLFSLRARMTALVLFVIFALGLLCFRLFFIQVVQSPHLQRLAEDQWTRALPIFANRGKILDTNGAVLAQSQSAYSLFSRGREVENPSAVATTLAQILGVSFASLIDKVQNKGVSEVLLASSVAPKQAVQITHARLKGIYLSENCQRHYPFGNLATQVLGFTTTDNQGQAGLELFFDQTLKGQNGYSLVQSDITGKTLENTLDQFVPSVEGCTLALTLDFCLQQIVEEALEKIMVEQKAKSASAILMKAKTGEILAMSQKPSFDLNSPPRQDVQALMDCVKNKMVVDVYEPGSTFKIITMAMALESGVAHLSDRFYCPGFCVVNGEKIKCWKSIGHGSQSLAEGLANSCNCVFTALAERLGMEKFYSYLDKFGYGQKTGIEIAGESSGLLMNPKTAKIVDLARMGFGQAVAVTPLQQIVGVACAVNGGNLVQPYLVKNITAPNGKVQQTTTPQTKRNVISAKTSQMLCQMLDLTVSMQTGKFTFVPGYAVGGKTGTTQKYENGAVSHNKYISSFVGVYPVDNPEYILLIAVDEPMAGAYYGSIVASPYAKEIFSKMFEYYSILPDDPKAREKLPKSFAMPNIVGLPLAKAISALTNLGLQFEIAGEGKLCTAQIPSANAKVFQTDTVLICT